MRFVDLGKLRSNREALRQEWNSKKPFRYLVIENFFHLNEAEIVLNNYPTVDQGEWDGKTYINQKNKFQQREFLPGSVFLDVFDELNSRELLEEIEFITGINDLIPDKKLFGGGLHQSRTGAFLDVHVDYNIHPETKLHRRLNIIVYMNKNWLDEYEGHLQLWDMQKKELIENLAPKFNRMVMFETNEVSFHGHPKPLKSPPDITRKSIAAYYYTESRPANEIAGEHNTIYVNTEGVSGIAKLLSSTVKAIVERIKGK